MNPITATIRAAATFAHRTHKSSARPVNHRTETMTTRRIAKRAKAITSPG